MKPKCLWLLWQLVSNLAGVISVTSVVNCVKASVLRTSGQARARVKMSCRGNFKRQAASVFAE